MAGGDRPTPITKIDGGPQQFNSEAYYYDGQPVAQTISGSGERKPVKTAQTQVRTDDQVVVHDPPKGTIDNGPQPTKAVVAKTTGTQVRRDPAQESQSGAGKGNCNTINYGDAGSGAHDYDSWNADTDRSKAKPGSTAEKWWQANDQLTKDLKTDNCLYTVQFGDSLSTIAQRELVTEGKAVTKQSLKNEMDLIVSLNDCHYQSLDGKRDRLQTGWKLALRSDCTGDAPPKEPVKQTTEPAPVKHELPPPPPPPQARLEQPLPPPPLPQRQPEAYYPPPLPPPMRFPQPMNYGLVPEPIYRRPGISLEFLFGHRHRPHYPMPYEYQTGGYQYQNGGYIPPYTSYGQQYPYGQTNGGLQFVLQLGGGGHRRWR